MKKILLLAAYSLLVCISSAKAQINNYLKDTWQENATLENVAPPMGQQPSYIIISNIIARDFNLPSSLQYAGVAHLKTLYKRIHINTPAGADSLTQLVLPIEADEKFHYIQARSIYPDGHSNPLKMEPATMTDGRKAILLLTPQLQAGCQVEYDLTVKVYDSYNGIDQLQSAHPCQSAAFILRAPSKQQFRIHYYNSTDQVNTVEENNVRVYVGTFKNIPPINGSSLYFPAPHILSVGFALYKEDKNATPLTWQQWGEQSFIQYVNTDRFEVKRLEKELDKWPFLRQRMPLPALIYQVEHQLKTQYPISASDEEGPVDIATMLRSKATTPYGMVRLMASVYYALGIRCQLLFTSARDEMPIDTGLLVPKLAHNVLLYFPDVKLALAPTETNTRFPFIPPMWGNIPGVRTRDTLANNQSKILTDIITTPLPDYTRNNISVEAALRINANADSVQLQCTQTFGGYPATTLRQLLATPKAGSKEEIFASLLPIPYAGRGVYSQESTQGSWATGNMNEPVTLRTRAAAASMIQHNGKQLLVKLGDLLTNQSPRHELVMPPQDLPVEMAFPFYLERRITFDIPKGYKVTNLASLNKDLHEEENGKQLLGYKMNYRLEDQQLHIYAMEWYQRTTWNGKSKDTFRQIMQLISDLKASTLILEKE